MGLDMYLTLRRRRGAYSLPEMTKLAAEFGRLVDLSSDSVVVNIDNHIGYWRKANHIQGWFEKNLDSMDETGGELENCYDYWVTMEELNNLREDCERVLENRELAEEVFPPQRGFFFGSTEIDEWYWHGVEHTLKVVKLFETAAAQDMLELGRVDFEIYYHGSW